MVANPLGYDFALLGLQAHEARVDVIRKAAIQTALRISQTESGVQEQANMLSHVAASTYRLLDPRRRKKAHERVQLCVFSEHDLDSQKGSRLALLKEDTGRKEGGGISGNGLVPAELVV